MMKTTPRLPIAAVFAMACGCFSVEPSPLTPLSSYDAPYLSLSIEEGAASLSIGSTYDCPTVRANATLNGQPLEQVEEGAVVRDYWPGDGCISPRWAVPWPVPDVEISEFELFDDTSRLTLGVRHLGAERRLVAGEGGPIALRWGELAQLPWSPSSDTVTAYGMVLKAGDRVMPIPDGVDHLSYVDGSFRFRLPPEPYDGGDRLLTDARIEFQVLKLQPGIAHCLPSLRRCGVEQNFAPTAYPLASVAVTVE